MGNRTFSLFALLVSLLVSSATNATLQQSSFLNAAQDAEKVALVEVLDVEVVWAKALFSRHGIALSSHGPDKLLSVVRARVLPTSAFLDDHRGSTPGAAVSETSQTKPTEVRFVLLGGVKDDIGQAVSGAGNVVIGQNYVVLLGKTGPGGIRRIQGHGVGLLKVDDVVARPVLDDGRVFPEDAPGAVVTLDALFHALQNLNTTFNRPSTTSTESLIPSDEETAP
ncbi:MAG: hypothetical protein GY822_32720 [Deltaproteobacteria bacterium]|nr:hypothetical protein [Deltaproteobacteria bacterium]